jgi:polyisoprenoid-binding protein YceI
MNTDSSTTNMKLKTLLIAVNLLAVAAMPLRAAEMIRLDSAPGGNKIRIEGTSTIHDWQVEGTIVGGFAEVGPGFPLAPGAEAKPGKMDVKVSVFIPVRSLKSIEKDGKPYKSSMDDIMYKHLREPDNKKITYTLTELTLKEAPKEPKAAYQFEAKGELCVAGVTNKITMPVMATVISENKVKFAGTVSVKMTDYKVEPPCPAIALGLIKTGDDIKLFFEWVAAKKAPAAAK